MKRNQKEVQEAAMLEDEDDLRAVMRYLAPWVEKGSCLEPIGRRLKRQTVSSRLAIGRHLCHQR